MNKNSWRPPSKRLSEFDDSLDGDEDTDAQYGDSLWQQSDEERKPSRRRSASESDYSPAVKRTKEKKAKHKPYKQVKKKPRDKSKARTKRKHSDQADDVKVEVEEEVPRQCFGPGCVEVAREGSKYCSDECGLKLANNRIFEILPQRIQQWHSSVCIAEENNKQTLEKIRREQLTARQKLVDLDQRHLELDALIERGKQTPIAPEQENADTDDEGELMIYCVTCGHEVSQRAALKHMEKCFAKYEAQTSFGSIYKTRIEGTSMFCDYFSTQSKTYCKRLKVLCPEHTKEPKVPATEVCGCPLVTNVFQETGEYCNISRRKCNKHHCWEKLRRAEIDMERVRQWIKLDDLFEQERNIRTAMANRAGVLGLVLHQTVDHDPMNPVKTPIIT